MNLRKKIWLIGDSLIDSLANLNRLPVNKTILARYAYLRSNSQTESIRDIFKVVLVELKEVWGKGGIPIKPDKDCVKQLLHLFKQWETVQKLNEQDRQLPTKTDHFTDILNQLCDISAIDAYAQLSRSRRPNWKEDWEFLENQRKARKFYMTLPDQTVSAYMQRQVVRKSNYQLNQQRKTNAQLSRSQHLSEEEIRQQLDCNSDDDADEEFAPSTSKRRKSARTVPINVPSNNISEILSPAADRSGISIRQQLRLTTTLLTSSGGSLDGISLSRSTVHRQRKTAREKNAERIKESWKKAKPQFTVLHWDSKLFQNVSGEKQDRVAVVISGSVDG